MKHLYKLLIVLAILVGLLATFSISSAQPPPDNVINPILADLSQRVGRTLTIDDLAYYSWTTRTFNNESLDCPSPDQTYTRSFVAGYIVRITYGQLFWDYRYDGARNTFFLCNSPNLDLLVLPVTATPTVPPTSTPLPVTVTPIPTNTLPPTATVTPLPAQSGNTGNNTTGGQSSQPVVRVSVTPNPATLQEGERPCPDAITGQVPTRLSIGSVGQFAGSPQNIYQDPNRTSAILGVTTVGDTFSVLAGPECDRTFTWWQVDTAGLLGWVGEVNPADLSYWLAPSGETAAPVPSTQPDTATGSDTATAQNTAPQVNTIAEFARQEVANPQFLLTTTTTANPEGIAVIGGDAGLFIYSYDDLTAPLFTLTDQAIAEVALSPDGNGIIVIQAGASGTYDLAFYSTAGQSIGSAPLSAAYVQGMAFLPSLNLLALGGENNVLLYDLASNQVVAELALNTAPLALASHADTSRLAILLPDQVLVMDINTRSELGRAELRTSEHGAVGMAFSPDGNTLAVSNGASGEIPLLDLSTFQPRVTLSAYPASGGETVAIAFSADGSRIVTAGGVPTGVTSSDQSQVLLWDGANGQLIGNLGGVTGDQSITDVAFSPNGQFVNAISRENSWQLWGVQ